MDDFVKELMIETLNCALNEGSPTDDVVAELLLKHYGIRFHVMNYHYCPIPRPSHPRRRPFFIPEVYGEVIVDQLIPKNTIFFMMKNVE